MRSRPGRRVLLAGFASVAALTLAGPASAAEKIVFLTSWYAQAEHGGFYQAKATGLYEKAGLDVEIRMGGPQVNGMQLLLAGEADAIMGFDFQVLQAVEKGLPAVTVAASFQYDLQGMMTHEDVKSLAGVKDKTILVAGSGMTSWWPWLKKKYALSDAQVKAYTFNLQPFFADKTVVQQAYPSSEPFQAQEKGVPVNFYLFAKDGYPPYGTTIVTTRKLIESKPDAMRKFVAASMEGWKSYMADPAPGNALIKKDNPKMTDGQIAFGIAKLKELKVLGGDANVPIGTMTEARWKTSYNYLVEAGLLKPETDWKKAFSLAFMPVLTAKAE
ncbi:ABC transporter substrate-binding protein [Methylobacterium organophilum]|uniref:ABC transporter substrate-binding protein n=1 Tax=Methylobacterium organophilum TaxID=410 RepID=UPI001F13BF35|nr:ABC transporter substrate-binding protein [Methylobacterium organophilum]UMY17032.1 ABC transporter substrate-binding protein [Methylobacterium organophilum]